MNCDVRRPTLELPPNRHVSLEHYHLWARHARRYASAASSKRPTFASALAQFRGRKILPGHQSPLSEKTSYKLVSINWRDTFGIKTQALPCALSSSKKCNWPSSSFHNKFWNSGFEILLTAFLKTNLSLQNKSQFPASPVSKDQQLLWLPAKPESQPPVAQQQSKSLLRLRTRQAWNLRITAKNLPEICNAKCYLTQFLYISNQSCQCMQLRVGKRYVLSWRRYFFATKSQPSSGNWMSFQLLMSPVIGQSMGIGNICGEAPGNVDFVRKIKFQAKELLMTWPSLGDSSLSTGGLAPGETFQSCCIFRMNGIFQSAHKIPCLQGGSNGLFFLQQIYQPRAKIQSRSEVKTLFQELTWVHWKSTWSPNHSHFAGLLTTV